MSDTNIQSNQSHYWRKNIVLVLVLLTVWFMVSLGSGVLFRDWLDANFPPVGNAPFGFWMAQQGSIVSFVLLLVVYMVTMNRFDKQQSLVASDNK